MKKISVRDKKSREGDGQSSSRRGEKESGRKAEEEQCGEPISVTKQQ